MMGKVIAMAATQVTLILSGGITPTSNHYSQYKQVEDLSGYFAARPDVDLSVMFGSGLTPESPVTAMPDVIKESPEGTTSFIRGEIPHNTAATYENVDRYFNKTLAQRHWQQGDRFVLVVSDHGSPNDLDLGCYDLKDDNKAKFTNNYSDNWISLWQPNFSAYPERDNLSVTTLKDLIHTTIPEFVPVEIVMTQCYSGGFHRLAYSLDADGFPHRDAKQADMAVFTAISKDTTASGCTSATEEDKYDGYERRIAEEITGRAVLSGTKLGAPKQDLLTAHQNTLLSDKTKDTPLRTSESFMLDYLKALGQKDKALDEKLNDKWTLLTSPNSNLSALPSDVTKDLESRLALIVKLRAKLIEWYPEYKDQFSEMTLANIEYYATAAELKKDEEDKGVDDLRMKWRTAFYPLAQKYQDYLVKNKAKDLQAWQFENFFFMGVTDLQVFTRLSTEDKSLTSLAAYQNFQDDHTDIVMKWAKANLTSDDDKKNIVEADKQYPQLQIVANEHKQATTRAETLAGELRRLQYQMKVAAGTLILVDQSPATFVDFQNFMSDEWNAKI